MADFYSTTQIDSKLQLKADTKVIRDNIDPRLGALEKKNGTEPLGVVDGQVASVISQTETDAREAVHRAATEASLNLLKDSHGVVTPDQPLSYESLQEAANKAAEEGLVLVASGTLETDQTLTLKCSHDLSRLNYRYGGNNVAVRVGTLIGDVRAIIGTTPRTTYTKKPKTADGWDATSCGLEIVNLIGSVLTVPFITFFKEGIRMRGEGTGVVYNTITVGRLQINKINFHGSIGPAGSWNGENTIIGGQFSHSSTDPTPGTRQILITGSSEEGDFGSPTALRFIGTSIETKIAERIIDVQSGKSCLFIGCRFEDPRGVSRAPVHWGAKAQNNMIIGGFNAERIVETFDDGAYQNVILAPGIMHMRAADRGIPKMGGGLVVNNLSGNRSGALTVMEPAWTDQDPANDYAVKVSSVDSNYKRPADVYPRIKIEHDGMIWLGDGASQPSLGIGRAGGVIRFETAVSTQATTSGGADALPATPAGYASIYINGAIRKIPYY